MSKYEDDSPSFTEPIEALRFLSERLKHAGISHAVGLDYARDLDAILARIDATNETDSPFKKIATLAGGFMTPANHVLFASAVSLMALDEEEERQNEDRIRARLGDLLTSTANALRGKPPPLTLWSWADVPELAAAAVAALTELVACKDLEDRSRNEQGIAHTAKLYGEYKRRMPLAWETAHRVVAMLNKRRDEAFDNPHHGHPPEDGT